MLFVADEIKREREFYRARGLPCPKDILPNAGEIEEEKTSADAHAESDYHRADEQVGFISFSGIQVQLCCDFMLVIIWYFYCDAGERLSGVYKCKFENIETKIHTMFGSSYDNSPEKVYRQKGSQWDGKISRRVYRMHY